MMEYSTIRIYKDDAPRLEKWKAQCLLQGQNVNNADFVKRWLDVVEQVEAGVLEVKEK